MSSISKAVVGTAAYIKKIVESGAGPERGPYSFSRLGACPLKFKRDYIERAEGTELTRFGQNIGSAMHDLAELDVLMRIENDPDDWADPSDLVFRLVEAQPEYGPFMDTLTTQLEQFRFEFNINRQNYVSSEQHVGADLNMKWIDYDDPKCWFRGRIDYLEVDDSGLARVVDFKNYPGIHNNESLNNYSSDIGAQLMGYVAMVMAMDKRIQAAYYEVYYFRYGTSKSPMVFEDGRPEVRIVTREEVERWWKFNQRKMLVFERRQNFPAQPSQKACQYCRHVASCPWQQSRKREEIIATNEPEAKDLARRVIVLKEEEERLKVVLGKFTKQFGTLELEGGVKCGPIPQERTSVDVGSVLTLCEELGLDPTPYLSVTKTKANKLMKRLETAEHKTRLKDAMSVTMGTVTKYG